MGLNWATAESEVLLQGNYEDLALDPSQQRLILLHADGLRVMELRTLESLAQIAPHQQTQLKSMALDPKSHHVYCGLSSRGSVAMFGLPGMAQLHTARGPKQGVVSLVSAPETRRLFVAGQQGEFLQYNLTSNKPRIQRAQTLPHNGIGLSIAPDEHLLALGQANGCALYRADSLAFKRRLEAEGAVWRTAFSADGRYVAYTDVTTLPDQQGHHSRLYVYDLKLDQFVLKDGSRHQSLIRALTWHPQQPVLVTGDLDGQVQVWSIGPAGDEADATSLILDHTDVKQLTFTPDGQHLLVLTAKSLETFRLEGTPSLWQAPSPSSFPIHEICLEQDGSFFPHRLHVHGNELWISTAQRWFQIDLTQRSLLATSQLFANNMGVWPEPGQDLMARTYSAGRSQEMNVEVRRLSRDEVLREVSIPMKFGVQARITPDGETLVVMADGTLHSFPLLTSRPPTTVTYEEPLYGSVELDLPGPLLLSASGFFDFANVRLWNTETLASTVLLKGDTLQPLGGWTSCCQWEAQHQRLALGTSGGGVAVADAQTRQLRFAAHRHTASVDALAFSADGTLLASASADRTVRLWNVETGEELAVFSEHSAEVRGLIFLPEDAVLVSVDAHGTVLFWDLEHLQAWVALQPSLHVPAGELTAEVYVQFAQRARIPQYATISWEFHTRWSAQPRQQAADVVTAYYEAKDLAGAFKAAVEAFAAQRGLLPPRTRPNDGVKNLERVVEKMKRNTSLIPHDLLGATIICRSIEEMYAVAQQVQEGFSPLQFRDRMIFPVESGYRDLRFLIAFEGHIAELKIVHTLFQELDLYEHRMYEIQRSIAVEFHGQELPLVPDWVTDALNKASVNLYSRAWKRVLTQEEG